MPSTPLTMLIVCLVALTGASLLSAEPAAGRPRASAKPTAHDPHYQDAKAWPADVMKSYHANVAWPAGRQWTWAHPGSSVGERDNPLGPEHWLENGKPAVGAWDENTDLDFPDSDTAYFVNIAGSKSPITWRRHLTVGRNAMVGWLHGAKGNTWIKAGGKLTVLSYIGGDQHTFLRNDNAESWWMVDHLFCVKDPKASVEIIGPFSVDDSYHFTSGLTILGVDSILTPQARSNLNIQPEAGLALLSGATYRKQGNQTFATDLVVRGKLMGGLPERPLTRDATIGLSWKGKRRFLGGKNTTFRSENPDDAALIVMPGFARSQYVDGKGWQSFPQPAGSLQVFTGNPSKARLVLDWNGLPVSQEAAKGGAENQANFAKLSEVKDTFIDLVLLGDVTTKGLFINRVAKGGLVVADPADERWKAVGWGDKNQGRPNETLVKWDGKPRSLFNNATDF